MSLIKRYHPTIWIRVIGTVIAKICEFMLRSFIGIYLYEHLGQDLVSSAMAVTLGPLTSLILGFFAGSWSDRVGRKPLMVGSVILQAATVIGFAAASDFWHFAVLSILSGVSNSLYWPAANAQVADLVPEAKRGEVYALMHTALNMGAAIGPMIGVFMYRHNAAWAFGASFLGLLVYAVLLITMTAESAPLRDSAILQSSSTPKPRLNLRVHWPVIALTLAAVPVGLLYSQIELILPIQLKSNFDNYLVVYGLLMSINGTAVTVLQLVIQKFSERFRISSAILVAYLLMALTAVGYGVSKTVALMIAAEILFTLGEMLNGPQLQRVVAKIAPVHLRGRYFAVFTMSWGISGVIGPNLGAFAMTRVGGMVWFIGLAGLIAIAGIVQFFVIRKVAENTP